MVQNELNLFTIGKTLMKMKASLDVLVGIDEDKIDEIHKKYIKYATIPVDEYQFSQIDKSKSVFTKFMDQDEKLVLNRTEHEMLELDQNSAEKSLVTFYPATEDKKVRKKDLNVKMKKMASEISENSLEV